MKKTIEFDQRGYLYPYSLIELDLADFQDNFVDNFPKSETRQKVFANNRNKQCFEKGFIKINF